MQQIIGEPVLLNSTSPFLQLSYTNVFFMNTKSLLIPLLLLFGCVPTGQLGTYHIDTSCDLCIVEGEINGKKTYFLMDTGASLTTLDINQRKHFGFSSAVCDIQIAGINNNVTGIEQAIGVTSIRINEMEMTGDIVYTSNMRNLVKYVELCARKRISGVIGVPLIKKHRLVIDLTNSKLYKH